MKIIDISIPISEDLPIWPGDPAVSISWFSEIASDCEINLTNLCLGVHTGTHIDAPLHYIQEGKSIDQIELKKLIGPAQVVEIPEEVKFITLELLRSIKPITEKRLLFKTSNSGLWTQRKNEFSADYVSLDACAARYLVENGVELVGIDYLSIAPYDNSQEIHKILLEREIVILEGINLSDVEPGLYQLVCLPIKLDGREASPSRAILIDLEH